MSKNDRGWVWSALHRILPALSFLLPSLVMALVVGSSDIGLAQSSTGLSADTLGQLQQQFGQQGGAGNSSFDLNGNGQGNVIIQAAPALNAPPLPPSRLEQIL